MIQMKHRLLLASVLGAILSAGAFAADVIVRVAPPRPLVEHRVPAPGRGYVWTPGYHRYDGGRYVWAPGAWVMPPRGRAHWVPAHWTRHRGGWVLVEGHWR